MRKLRLGVYLLFVALFGLFSYFAHRLPYFPGDVEISLWVQEIDLPLFSPIMKGISFISSVIPAVIIVGVVVIILWVLRKRLEAVFIGPSAGLASLINLPIKLAIDRPRPTNELIQVLATGNESSFPSGHTLYAVIFYGFMFYLSPKLIKNRVAVKLLRSILVILILATMTSRIYLGAHWFSDVLGGFFFGGLVLAATIALYRHYAGRSKPMLRERNA
ncbi:MAG: phosphatase PAP2 family protein [Chloroflexi bacterium]|nr:phosphatase PAP2 family protein [Chloroflexota bacterium]